MRVREAEEEEGRAGRWRLAESERRVFSWVLVAQPVSSRRVANISTGWRAAAGAPGMRYLTGETRQTLAGSICMMHAVLKEHLLNPAK